MTTSTWLNDFYKTLVATLPGQRKPELKKDHIVDHVSIGSNPRKTKFDIHVSCEQNNAILEAYTEPLDRIIPAELIDCAAHFFMAWNGTTSDLFSSFQTYSGTEWLVFRYIYEISGIEQDMTRYITLRFAAGNLISNLLPGMIEDMRRHCK